MKRRYVHRYSLWYAIVVKAIASLVAIVGALVILGRLLDVQVLKNPLQEPQTMLAVTAACFVLTGAKLYFMLEYEDGKIQPAQIILSSSSLIIMLVMATLLVSQLFSISTGIEQFWASSAGEIPSSPSVFMAVNFLLVVAASTLVKIRTRTLKTQLLLFGAAILVISTLPIIGYYGRVPALTYAIPPLITPIGLLTAILFFLVGIALVLMSRMHSAVQA